jgi:hypothetical protein
VSYEILRLGIDRSGATSEATGLHCVQQYLKDGDIIDSLCSVSGGSFGVTGGCNDIYQATPAGT